MVVVDAYRRCYCCCSLEIRAIMLVQRHDRACSFLVCIVARVSASKHAPVLTQPARVVAVDLAKDTSQFQLLFTVYNPTGQDKQMLKWSTPMFTNTKDHGGFPTRSALSRDM